MPFYEYEREHELDAALRRAAGLFDPPDGGLLAAAVGAHAFRMPGTEVAGLTFDSRTGPASVRGDGHLRLLTFGGSGVTVDVEVTRAWNGYRLLGMITPPMAAEATIRGAAPISAAADRLGRFAFDQVPGGPLSLLIGPSAGRSLAGGIGFTTEWVML